MTALVLLLVPALLLVPTVRGVSPAWTPAPTSWSNGVVLCDFVAASPEVAVSSPTVAESGLSMELAGLSEVGPNGSVTAMAALAGATWAVANNSTDDAYDLAYTTTVALTTGPTSTTPLGSADLRVDFILPTYVATPGTALDQVTVELTVTNWSWQGDADALTASIAAWPSYATQEHLVATPGSLWMLSSAANSSGTTRERMSVAPSATIEGAESAASNVSAISSAVVAPTRALVTVDFGSAGPFRTLTYDAHVGVVLPATVVGIPLPELIGVAAAGAVVSLGVAVVARRLRRRPSDLVFVEENA